MRSVVVLSTHSAFHWWSSQWAARMLIVVVRYCYAVGKNGCLDFRRRASALDGRVSADWIRRPGSIARRARDSVASLRRSSAGWMSASMGRLSSGVGRRHPVTIRKASLMAGSIRQVWVLWHQAGEKSLWLNAPGLGWLFATMLLQHTNREPASRLKSATRDASFLRSDSCRWYVSDLPNVTPWYLEVFNYSCYVPTAYKAPLPLPANLHQHPRFLGRQHMHTFWRQWLANQRWRCWREGAPGQTLRDAVLEGRNLLLLPFPVVRIKLWLATISMNVRTIFLSDSNRSCLQVRPRYHAVS